MTDVFLTTCATPSDPIRWHLFQAVKSRWELEPDIRLHIVSNEVEKCEPRSFDGWRRRVAEDNATSEIYLCCDDDILPMGKDFVKRGLNTCDWFMETLPVIGCQLYGSDLKSSGYKPILMKRGSLEVTDSNILVGSTAGGVNFIRRGVLKEVLPKAKDEPLFDESSLGNELRSLGFQTGYMLDPQVNHLGASISTLWPEPFTAMTQIA